MGPNPWLRLAVTLCLIASAVIAFAKVAWVDGGVYGGRFGDFYDALESAGWLEKWFTDDSDLVMIEAKGASLYIAYSSVSEEWLSVQKSKFEKWTDGISLTQFYRIQEEEEAGGSLAVGFTAAGSGAVKLSAAIDIKNLREKFPGSAVFVRLAEGLSSSLSSKPELEAGGFSYWRIDGDNDEIQSLTLSSKDQSLALALLFVLTFLSLPMILIGRWISEAGAKKHGLKTEQGRRAYSEMAKILTVYLPYGSIGIFCLLSIFGVFDQAWGFLILGFQGQGLVYPVVSLFFITHLFIASSYRNKKVFGRNEAEDAIYQNSKARSPLVVQFFGSKVYPHLYLLGVIWLLFGILIHLADGSRLGSASLIALGLAALIIWFGVTHWIKKKGAGSEEELRLLDKAAQSLRFLGASDDKKVPAIRLLKSAHWPKYYGLAASNVVLLTPDLVSDASEEELAFVVGHELAHIKLGHIEFRKKVILGLFVLPIISIVLGLTFLDVSYVMEFLLHKFFAFFCIWLIGYLALARLVYPKQEFEADAEAARMTGCPLAGAEAYKKLTAVAELPGLHSVDLVGTHPPMPERIARLEAMSLAPNQGSV